MAIGPDDLDEPGVLAEVRAAFEAYEAALLGNDVEAMDDWFWDDPRTVRYGLAEIQHGFAAISAWRRAAAPVPADRRVVGVRITAHGADVATVTCEFRNGDDPTTGRQSQTWVRTPAGWRVVSAHVSMLASG